MRRDARRGRLRWRRTTCMCLRNVSTRSALAKRAVRAVGSTWFTPGDVVAERRGRPRADEHRAGVAHERQRARRGRRVMQLEVLGRDHVRPTSIACDGVVDEHDAAAGERASASISARRGASASRSSSAASTASATSGSQVTRTAAPPGPCSACARRSAAANSARRAAVGDDHHLRRARRTTRCRRRPATSRLAGGDVRVAGPDDHVDRADGLGAVGQRGDRLRAADPVHLVDADERGRRERGRGHARRRRPGGTHSTISATPATLRGDRGHQHGRRVRGATAGHVEAGAVDRDARSRASVDAVAVERGLGAATWCSWYARISVGGVLERGAQLGRGGVERGVAARRRAPAGRRRGSRRTAR